MRGVISGMPYEDVFVTGSYCMTLFDGLQLLVVPHCAPPINIALPWNMSAVEDLKCGRQAVMCGEASAPSGVYV